MTSVPHVSVLGDAAVAALHVRADGLYVDGTFGAGGYTRRILAAGGRVIAFDRDPTAIAAGKSVFAETGPSLALVERPFDALTDELAARAIPTIDGAVFDFGVSSMQLDQAARGFSFMADGPLDMRMGAGRPVSEFVNSASAGDLADVIFQYGEERRARHLANLIVSARADRPFRTTGELAALAEKALGRGAKIHPATRLFQALRIFINDELGQIVRVLLAAEAALQAGGRLVAVSFHSLEDRIVKRFFAATSGRAAAGSRHEPTIVPTPATFEYVAKAISADEAEIAANPRARSATLRAATRTVTPATAWTSARLAELGVPPLVFSSLQQQWCA